MGSSKKLSVHQIHSIIQRRIDTGLPAPDKSHRKIADDFGVGKTTVEKILKQSFVDDFYAKEGLGPPPDMSQYQPPKQIHSDKDIADYFGKEVSELVPEDRIEYRRSLSESKKAKEGLHLDKYSKAKTLFRRDIELKEGDDAYNFLGRSSGGQIDKLADILNNEKFLDKYGYLVRESGLDKLEDPNLQTLEAIQALREFRRLFALEHRTIVRGETKEYDLTKPEDKAQLLKDAEWLAIRSIESEFGRHGAAGQALANNPRMLNMYLNDLFRSRIVELYYDVPISERKQLSHIHALNAPDAVGLLNPENLFIEDARINMSRGAPALTEESEPEAYKYAIADQARRQSSPYITNSLLDPMTHGGLYNEALLKQLANDNIPFITYSDKRLSTAQKNARLAAENAKSDLWARQIRDRLRAVGTDMYDRVGKRIKSLPSGALRMGLLGRGGGGGGKY